MSRRALMLAVFLLAARPVLCADLDALARQLADKSFQKREAALQALVAAGDRALPVLQKAAQSANPEVQWRADTALRMIRWDLTLEQVKLLGDPFAGYEAKTWYERERLVMDVAAVGGKTAMPALARVLTVEKSPLARRAAAVGLLRMGPEGLLALEHSGAELLGIPHDDPRLRIEIGNGFLEEGKYDRAITEYQKAIKLSPKNQTAWYNLACAYARLKKLKDAMAALRTAVESGFKDIDWLKKDPDLENLREDDEYKEFINALDRATPKDAAPLPDE